MSAQETWSAGKTGGCVVSDTAPPEWKGGTGHDHEEYYGGFLVAESIALVRWQHLISAAPDMFDLLTGPYWLVWSNEHRAWWGPNRRQYFLDRDSAGRYTLEEALLICKFRSREVGVNPPELIQPAPEWLEKRIAAIDKATHKTLVNNNELGGCHV